MTEKEQPNDSKSDPVGKAILMLAKWGREAEEAPRNAIYEGMTPEEVGIAVFEKVERGELKPIDMTQLEHDSWVGEINRQMDELLAGLRDLDREYDRLLNAHWNYEHYAFLLKGIRESVWHKLTAEEQAAFLELLESRHWGPAEVEQAKEIVETAQWFSKLGAR